MAQTSSIIIHPRERLPQLSPKFCRLNQKYTYSRVDFSIQRKNLMQESMYFDFISGKYKPLLNLQLKTLKG